MPIKEILGGISQWAENGMKSGYKVSFALLWEDSSGYVSIIADVLTIILTIKQIDINT